MKYLTCCMFYLFLSGVSLVYSQQTVHVSPGQGTLEAAINSAGAGDVLQLTAGGVYSLSAGASTFGNFTFPVTIEVEQGSTEKAVICLGPGASTTKKYYFFTINDGAALTLRGLDIHGLYDDSAVAASMLIFDARPDPSLARIGNFRFENCLFHDFKDYIIHGMKDDYARGLIQDSVFVDNVVVYNAKHFLQYKHVSLHHLEMKNSTIYDLTGMALKIGKIGYRCVLENPNKPYIPLTDETITPTGFIDHCTMNNLGDIHGHVQVDEPYHTLRISNCIVTNQQQFDQPPIYFNESTVDSAGIMSNSCFWNTAGFNGTDPQVYIFRDTIQIDPQYRAAAEADFSLPANSPLRTFGSNGEPIGDPRWTRTGTGTGDLMVQEMFSMRCFPNPFVEELHIEFNLQRESFVTMKIYDILGEEVAILSNGKEMAGLHTLAWHAGDFKPGIYFVRIISGDFTRSEMIILNK